MEGIAPGPPLAPPGNRQGTPAKHPGIDGRRKREEGEIEEGNIRESKWKQQGA
jgi:hypothetical protein